MQARPTVIGLLLLASFGLQGCIGAVMGLGRLAAGGHEGRENAAAVTTYVPAITLTESPRTIEARAQLDPFETIIFPANPEHPRDDQDVTKTAMNGTLADLVRQAILADFRTNSVYRSVRLHEEQPDLTIRGNIYQFSEYRSKPWYAKIPLIGRLFATSDRIEGGVSLDLMISTSNGLLIGIYSGESRFTSEDSSAKTAPKNHWAPGNQLNRAFTEAMRQIRTKMLSDNQLVSGGWRRFADQRPSPLPDFN